MVSEAVEEVLNLVQNATQTFKAMVGAENDPLTQGQIKLKLKFFFEPKPQIDKSIA